MMRPCNANYAIDMIKELEVHVAYTPRFKKDERAPTARLWMVSARLNRMRCRAVN
jgi:hypothetical protein